MATHISVKSEVVKREGAFEDEPMDTSETALDLFNEEGEVLSSDEENIRSSVQSSVTYKNYVVNTPHANDSGGFVTGIDIFDEEENSKKVVRAKRFALSTEDTNTEDVNNELLSKLHTSLGLDKENERHYRLNAVHMRGTKDMSTEDVFRYFRSYAPNNIEWINDVSCNVVWVDHISAARALICLSKAIKNLHKIHANGDPFEKEMKEKDDISESITDQDDAIDARQIEAAIPPGLWRIGTSDSKSPTILLRYATRSDRKQKYAERNSEYYKKYGNPHFGNVPGILSKTRRENLLRKKFRKPGYSSQDSFDQFAENSEGEDDRHVNDERKNPWGSLAQSWNKIDQMKTNRQSEVHSPISLKRPRPVADLRMSLNVRNKADENDLDGDVSDTEKSWEQKLKIPRMKMYADEEEKKERKREKVPVTTLAVRTRKNVPHATDLRSRLGKKVINRTSVLRGASSKVLSVGEDRDSEASSNEDKDSGDWALEQYHDLRESLEQNKKKKAVIRKSSREMEDSEDDDLFIGDIGQRSPLQIEIDNDKYYCENDSDSSD